MDINTKEWKLIEVGGFRKLNELKAWNILGDIVVVAQDNAICIADIKLSNSACYENIPESIILDYSISPISNKVALLVENPTGNRMIVSFDLETLDFLLLHENVEGDFITWIK